MKIRNFFAIAALLALAMPSAFAFDGIDVQTAVEGASTTSSVNLKIGLEWQIGINAYRKIGTSELEVHEGADSTYIVNFLGQDYSVRFDVRGYRLESGSAPATWVLFVTQNQILNGKAVAEPKTVRFFLDQGQAKRHKFTGTYRTQARNLRLTFSY